MFMKCQKRTVYAVMIEQRPAMTGVLACNDIGHLEHLNRPKPHVAEIADGCGD
jgi:hypothetical protein